MNNINENNIDQFLKSRESEFNHLCNVIEKALENQPETHVLINLAVAGWILTNTIAGAMKAAIETKDPNTLLNLGAYINRIIQTSISEGESTAWELVLFKKEGEN